MNHKHKVPLTRFSPQSSGTEWGLEAGALGRGTSKKAIFLSTCLPILYAMHGVGVGAWRGLKAVTLCQIRESPSCPRQAFASLWALFLRLLANQPLMCQLFIHQNCQTLWISSPLLWLAHSKTLTFSKFCSRRRKGKIAKNSIPANTVTRRYVTGGVAS